METDVVALELRKVANLLALRQIDGLSRGEQARVLSLAGYSNAEIAALTGSSEGSIRAMLSQGRRRAAAED
jgi:DNA-directed RNA polymerase specialized sigma24 family protein